MPAPTSRNAIPLETHDLGNKMFKHGAEFVPSLYILMFQYEVIIAFIGAIVVSKIGYIHQIAVITLYECMTT
jgi:hypothetical protein